MREVTLYHVPPSFYSQIARIVLAEKGVGWISKWIAAGPPIHESYQPWYMRLNPGGTVPTMLHGGQIIPDSFDIARYVELHFEGPALVPGANGERAGMERWIGKLGDISVRELSYGNEKLAWLASRVNRSRLRNLKRREIKNPDLAEVYRAKFRDIEEFSNNALDSAHVEQIRLQVRSALDEMEIALAKNPWLCGGHYSLADAFWTVAVARFQFLNLEPLRGRPALAEWHARVKARPSFRTADIWESFQFSKMLPVLLQKLGPRLAVAIAAIGGLWALIWWLL